MPHGHQKEEDKTNVERIWKWESLYITGGGDCKLVQPLWKIEQESQNILNKTII